MIVVGFGRVLPVSSGKSHKAAKQLRNHRAAHDSYIVQNVIAKVEKHTNHKKLCIMKN